jgi:hypothetical protein
MRKTLERIETVHFVCDNKNCEKEETLTFRNEHPEVPLGWISLHAPDTWIAIEGKTRSAQIEIHACSQMCLNAALEDLIDDTLDQE